MLSRLTAGCVIARTSENRVRLIHRITGAIGHDPIHRPPVQKSSPQPPDLIEPRPAPAEWQVPQSADRQRLRLIESAQFVDRLFRQIPWIEAMAGFEGLRKCVGK